MYYIIETDYVGPVNRCESLDTHWLSIQTEPGRTNSSGELREKGWLGETCHWSSNAHGVFHTLEAAKAYIEAEFGKCREIEEFDDEGGVVVAAYSVGEFERVSYDTAESWIYGGIEFDVDHRLSEKEISALADEYIREARESDYQMDISAHAEKIIEEYVNEHFPEDDDEEE